ncbi:hypothetical protein [Nocardia pseudovaccinii]|uniref:hypothetical protein n=1 Tax=Nocardia pseudovaccinii TaxID=189540 RepID=UPI0035A2201A
MPPRQRIEFPGRGPEDIVIGRDGLVNVSIADGEILRRHCPGAHRSDPVMSASWTGRWRLSANR